MHDNYIPLIIKMERIGQSFNSQDFGKKIMYYYCVFEEAKLKN